MTFSAGSDTAIAHPLQARSELPRGAFGRNFNLALRIIAAQNDDKFSLVTRKSDRLLYACLIEDYQTNEADLEIEADRKNEKKLLGIIKLATFVTRMFRFQ